MKHYRSDQIKAMDVDTLMNTHKVIHCDLSFFWITSSQIMTQTLLTKYETSALGLFSTCS